MLKRIPHKDKRKWIAETALSICNENPVRTSEDDLLWRRYNSDFKGTRFDYLTEIGEYSLPMKDRHIPLQRRIIDRLIAQKNERNFKYKIRLDDIDSRKQKFREKNEIMVDFILKRSQEIQESYEDKIEEINDQLQSLMELSQGDEIDPKDKLKIKFYQRQLQKITKKLSEGKIFNDKMLEEIQEKDLMTPTERMELVITKYATYLENKYDFNRLRTKSFKRKAVTGKQAYLVFRFKGNNYFREIDASRVVYPKDRSTDKINQRDWAYYIDRFSIGQFIELFGKEFIEHYGQGKFDEFVDNYNISDNRSFNTGGTFLSTPKNNAIFIPDDNFSNNDYKGDLDIKWVFFRASEDRWLKTSTDKHGNKHSHLLKPGKKLIDKDKYRYSKGTYYKKDDSSIYYKKDEVVTYSASKDELEHAKWQDIYMNIVINDDYVIPLGRYDGLTRSVDNYNRFNLPIFGNATDTYENAAFSLIKQTWDIQELIDIFQVMKEYMVASSGSKGVITDESLRPDDMTPEEHDLDIKQGMWRIQTTDEHGNQRSTFNQFKTYDNTLSQSVVFLDQLTNNLISLMGDIIGTPYQMLGQTKENDQVTTNLQATKQGLLTTEMFFKDSEDIDKEAFKELLMLTIRHEKEGKVQFSIPNYKHEESYILDIDTVKDKDLDFFLIDAGKDLVDRQEIKSIVMQYGASLQMGIEEILSIWDTDTISEMRANFRRATEQREKINQELAQTQGQIEFERQKELISFEKEMEAYVEKVKANLEQSKEQIERKKLDLETYKNQIDQRYKEFNSRVEQYKAKTDRLDKLSNISTENALLKSEDKHRTVDELLRMIEMQITGTLEGEKIKATKVKEHINDN